MNVTGQYVERKSVQIHVDPFEVIRKLRAFWLTSIGQPGHYINSDGIWEDWTDTGHGSGLYDRFGQATPEQITILKSFDFMTTMAKAFEDKANG